MTNKIAKYTNYNAYILVKGMAAHKVNEKKLEEVVEKLTKMYKNPYIRFMWVANSNKAMCVVYSDTKRMSDLQGLFHLMWLKKLSMNTITN